MLFRNLLQELFQTPYFCIEYDEKIFRLAKPFKNNILLKEMAEISKKLNVVLPISYFEKENNAYYNSIAIIDSDGKILGNYRKSHIPDGAGYLEKYYFNPGDTGFKVWDTKFGKLGIAICWDQWFPEVARIMTLKGADILFYPTAIGDEPRMSEYDSSFAWQRVMQGTWFWIGACPIDLVLSCILQIQTEMQFLQSETIHLIPLESLTRK